MAGGIELTREKVADFFAVSLPTVDVWLRRGCPGQKVGTRWSINSAEVSQWLRDRERQDALGETAAIDETEARRRKIAAEASLAELDLAMKQAAVVPIAMYEAQIAAMIGAARAKLLNLGAKVGPLVLGMDSPAEARAIIDGAVHEVLAELGEFDDCIPGNPGSGGESAESDPESGEVMVAAAGFDRKSVGRRKQKAKS